MKDDPTNTVAALGLRVHSGWAALVALAEPVAEPKVIGRNRIELVESGKRDYLQPYHAAAELEFGEADAFIKRRFTVSQSIAIQALGAPIERLRREGYRLARCGLLLSSGLPPADLRATLQSHALIHAAEGHFFREALLEACRHQQLTALMVRERDLYARAAQQLAISPEGLQCKAVDLGRSLGPPWTQDQKYAALVAWLALAERTISPD